MKAANVPLDRDQMEARLHSMLGRFFVTFARIELNLSLRVGGKGSFAKKLKRLLALPLESGESEELFCKIQAWHKAADSLRDMRNLFAHGRWGYHVYMQQVIHVSGYPPAPQPERRFSLSELDGIAKDAELLSEEFCRLGF
jgi:hypothetical protein